ncbi:mannose-1-phosphate guanylyltransferase/mannose-6-phosphate isomerase [Shewanella sp. VB17]|uniref:mannose-1-phosphate guanylyltransferase/mannose-6-phosphate isomerase n=1 Tax=Shewanella sp. VB17 TaxID=2739432 RepID=UPI002815704F|nr:mannose-1-phosphate guanylyltransferase/mannose-6-phosphate isomerase [Shewanella sp. VB17]
MIPVIMAGGSGTRLWPMSRKAYPKQFLQLVGEKTLIQQTCERASAISKEAPIIICNEDHRFLCAEQLRQIGIESAKILLEPIGKNTAPAIALAAEYIQQQFDDAVMVVMSADHYIDDTAYFADTVRYVCEHAYNGHIITFGVTPTQPETGYGYIKKGAASHNGIYNIAEFVEKPNKETAIRYMQSQDYLWNSGMFTMKASSYLAELVKFEPQMYDACHKAVKQAKEDLEFIRPDKTAFAICPENSIDYAVMENTDKGLVIEFQSSWSDIGSWSSIWELADKDVSGNHCQGETILVNAHNNYVHSLEKHIAILGLDNLIVIDTKDALLIANKDQVQNIKQVVEQLKAGSPQLTENHRQVYRPWGHYDSIGSGERYQVKKITVSSGEKLSVQMHYHRAEHWIVVKGTANVTVGEKETLVTENQSVYIPIGEIHSLENKGKIPLELIEVQSGTYLGEDDIVRFTDIYGRVS